MEQNLIQDISRITKRLMINDLFYGLFLSTIEKVEDKKIPIAAVSLNKTSMEFKLLINPDEWFKYTDEVRYGILWHESMHLTNFHLLTSDLYPNAKMDNIGCDCEINQFIGKSRLPSWGVFIEDLEQKYPQLDWKRKAGRDHYYKELNKLSDKEKEDLGIDEKAEHIWIIVDKDGKEVDPSSLTDAEKDAIRVQVESTIESIAEEIQKSQGSIPSEINSLIKGFKKPKPVFNYKKYIRNFVGNSTKYFIKSSKLKENQRFPGQPKIVLRPMQKLAVFLDFSGSVSTAEAFEFLNECAHLSKKTDLEIHSFDTKVYPAVKYKAGSNDFPRQCNGGTDLQAPIDYFNSRKDLHTAIIYTDGHFSQVKVSPKNTLIVISSNGTTDNVKNFKNVIKIPKVET